MHKSCKKILYKTKEEAEVKAKNTNVFLRLKKIGGHKVSAYKCDKCEGYHLTSKDQKNYMKIGISDEEYEKIKKQRERNLKKEQERIMNKRFGGQI
jgi:spore maturation protein CgeB